MLGAKGQPETRLSDGEFRRRSDEVAFDGGSFGDGDGDIGLLLAHPNNRVDELLPYCWKRVDRNVRTAPTAIGKMACLGFKRPLWRMRKNR